VLEEKVFVRTAQLTEEKQKVEEQKAETDKLRLDAESQKSLVEIKNKEITDSITYAQRLQWTILPPFREITERWPESFLFYQPKDIVAADFYWMESSASLRLTFIATAGFTVHRMPCAMVSVVCSNALNRTGKELVL
jgi:hypothetical protein